MHSNHTHNPFFLALMAYTGIGVVLTVRAMAISVKAGDAAAQRKEMQKQCTIVAVILAALGVVLLGVNYFTAH